MIRTTCSECGTVLKLHVCHSNAGYYVGFWCANCGPYDRISNYFKTHHEALVELNACNARDSVESSTTPGIGYNTK